MVLETLRSKRDQLIHHQDVIIRSDAWIALWNADELHSLDIDNLDLEVHESNVYLTGYVITGQLRLLAENLVSVVPGVKEVHNELVVDSDLVNEVAQRLASDRRTRPYIVPVGAFYGWVHLGGEVPTQEIRSAVEEVAASVPDVRGVVTLPNTPGDGRFSCSQPEKDNCPFQPRIGDQVYASDGKVGKVTQVIINPSNRLVSHVVLAADFEAQGQTLHGEFLIPADAVDHSSDGNLFLTETLNKLAKYPGYQASNFSPAPPEWKPPFPYRPGEVLWKLDRSK